MQLIEVVIVEDDVEIGRERLVDPTCSGAACETELDDVIVQVNHPRGGIGGYFDVYGLDSETLVAEGKGGLFSAQVDQHPEFGPDRFSWDFDAMESAELPDVLHVAALAAESVVKAARPLQPPSVGAPTRTRHLYVVPHVSAGPL